MKVIKKLQTLEYTISPDLVGLICTFNTTRTLFTGDDNMTLELSLSLASHH